MSSYWFRPKTFGYGATPITWQGWVVTLAVVVAVLGLTLAMILLPQAQGAPPSLGSIIIWAAVVSLLIAGLVRLSRAKTDGEWKWRWGSEN